MSWGRLIKGEVLIGVCGAVALALGADQQPTSTAADAAKSSGKVASGFAVASSDIAQGKPMTLKQVFNGFGCTGQNVSPALTWQNAPAGTKSFAIMVHDPDAPTGSGWWHWVVYNIPATTTSIPEDAGNVKKNLLPAGSVQGRTDFGTTGFGGACPPPGKPHRYYFRVHALKVPKIEAPADATAAMIGFNVNANTIDKAELMATYGR